MSIFMIKCWGRGDGTRTATGTGGRYPGIKKGDRDGEHSGRSLSAVSWWWGYPRGPSYGFGGEAVAEKGGRVLLS